MQLTLIPSTAENPRAKRGAGDVRVAETSTIKTKKAPKEGNIRQQVRPATMEEMIENLDAALDKVEANKGAPGPDRQAAATVRKRWSLLRTTLVTALLDGSYRPGDIRRVWIPKGGGGERGLGIPNVIDRVVQEATRTVLEPLYEPGFHPSSHGFRPGRSCHTAIAEARRYIEQGYLWVVDIDLAKFFDRVNHQRLMARLAERVEDRRLLLLIGGMLRASVVMPDGVRVATEEGVPQGGPLSPLLSNVVLSELDEELQRRGHRFVRYADDCNIYVGSERSGERVMESVTKFIEGRLRLQVNSAKSAVARPETRHFLGFTLRPTAEGATEVLLSVRSAERLRQRILELTPRAGGISLRETILKWNQYARGWLGFFGICTSGVERTLQNGDAHLRRRLRVILLVHWKNRTTIARNLVRLGTKWKTAWQGVYEGRKGLWALSHCQAVNRGLRNAYFAERGLVSLLGSLRPVWEELVAPKQLRLPWDTARP